MQLAHYYNQGRRVCVVLESLGNRRGVAYSRVFKIGEYEVARIPTRNILTDDPVLLKGEPAPLSHAVKIIKRGLEYRGGMAALPDRARNAIKQIQAAA